MERKHTAPQAMGPANDGRPQKSLSDVKYAFRSLKLLIKFEPFVILWQALSIIAMTTTTLIPVTVVSTIVTMATAEASFKAIVLAVLTRLIIFFVCDAVANVAAYATDCLKRDFTVKVDLMLYQKLRHIDYEFHDDTQFLDYFTRALEEGASNIYETAYNIILICRQVVQSISLFTVVGALHPLTIVYALLIGVIYVIIKFFIARLSFMMRTEQRFFIRKRMYISRAFYLKDNMAEIKTTHIDDVLLARHEDAGERQVAVVDKFGWRISLLDVVGSFLIGTIYPVILGIVAYQASTAGTITLAAFSALTVAALSLSNLISRIVSSFTTVQDTAVECRVPFEVMALVPHIETGEGEEVDESFQSLKVTNCSFTYPSSTHEALHDINLEIHKGEKIALVGENGAGKTTIVKLLLRLYDPQQGRILYNGKDIRTLEASSLRQHVGAVFQNSEVYAATVAENVLLREAKNDEDRARVNKALEFSGLREFIETLPQGMDTLVTREFEDNGVVFSGGQRQKLAVARGHALNYDLLLLDEPSSSLDPLAETSLYSRMLNLGSDRTLVFISHRLSATVNADRIYLFADGRLAEAGTHEELLAKENGLYRKMFLSQAEKYREGMQDVLEENER